jgi:hypothetical protein
MGDRDLIDAVPHVTGEDSHEIRRRGFTLTGPEDSGPEPGCLLDALLVDLRSGFSHGRFSRHGSSTSRGRRASHGGNHHFTDLACGCTPRADPTPRTLLPPQESSQNWLDPVQKPSNTEGSLVEHPVVA